MTDAVTVTNEELTILCDIVAGWSAERIENLDADKRLAPSPDCQRICRAG
jgi:hypothetical protein